jgi:parallel beta helix pectate lyase-like protein
MQLMKVLRITGALIAAVLFAGTAHAQLFRAYLASTGLDTNTCELPAPCRLLPAALAAVADGGEIWILDSANYNVATVDIAKSVNILAVPGESGSVVATSGPAITIATPLIKVSLRNLVIVPLAGAGGTSGIVMTDGAALIVEQCLIANLPEAGIDVNAAARVQITDTTIRDNAFDGLLLRNGAKGLVARATITGNAWLGGDAGITVQSDVSGTTTTADIAYSTLGANIGAGVFAYSPDALGLGKVSVSVSDSQIVQNTTAGVYAQSDFGASVTLSASNSMIAQSAFGIFAQGMGTSVWASGNTVSDNGVVGFSNNAAIFESAGNNAVRNNGVDKDGTITVVTTE